MSSAYQILDNRSINQWKVAELKEELKKRDLSTKGLKDDLIQRLDEAVRLEREKDSRTVAADAQVVDTIDRGSAGTLETSKEENVDVAESIVRGNTENLPEVLDNDGNKNGMDQDVQDTGLPVGVDSANAGEEAIAPASAMESDVLVTESVLACDDPVPDSLVPENQVSDSISTDSVSINQKNELKDTIITDNVELEQDIVRPDMVEEPSSRNDVPAYNESHSTDNSNNVSSPDLERTNSSGDVGYPEKYNLDRSSGDNSMEARLPENKQNDSMLNADELRDKVESIEGPIVEKDGSGSTIAVRDGLSREKSDTHQDIDMSPVALGEKRKFHDGNNEPAKRQCRWNTETVKGPDPLSTTPRDPKKAIALKPGSSATDDGPKERIVPPSQRPPTNSLRIDHFLRPFTLKAVQELLGKTGNVNSFWMDHIKTHCYVTYSTIEEAIETRNTVYNLQWPPNGGRLLVAEYVDPEEVKMKLEAPPSTAVSASSVLTVPSAPTSSQPEPSRHLHRKHHPVSANLPPPPPPPMSKLPSPAREQLPPPPPLPENMVPHSSVTLDDLFRKTAATPRIYYLPLSEEQVAAKLAPRGKSMRQQ